MLIVRLSRIGKRGQAYFRVVILEHTKKPKGKFLELLGNYDPHKKEFKVDMERVNHWVSNGAQVSPTVNNLLVNYKYWDKPKVQSWKPKPQKHGKEMEKPVAELQKGTENATEETPKAEVAEVAPAKMPAAPAEIKTESPQPSPEAMAGEAVEPQPAAQ